LWEMCASWDSLCLRGASAESQCHKDVIFTGLSLKELTRARYVQRLHERIRLLEEQLDNQKRTVDHSDTNSSEPVRRTSTLQLGGNAPTSGRLTTIELGGLNTPTLAGTGSIESTASTPIYHTGNPVDQMTLRGNQSLSVENARYEWNEGDERESGTDAMGTGFKGNGHSGFFGTTRSSTSY